MAEDQVRSISRWLEIKAGLIVDRSEAVIICREEARPRCYFFRAVSSRIESTEKKNPEKRERNSIWPILDILIQLSGNVTRDFSSIRYLTAVDIRCLTSPPGEWYRKTMYPSNPLFRRSQKRTSPSPPFHPRFLSSFAGWSPVDQTFVSPNWFVTRRER